MAETPPEKAGCVLLLTYLPLSSSNPRKENPSLISVDLPLTVYQAAA